MRKYLLPKEGAFYKANLHCHSRISDGFGTPEQLRDLYKSKGYSVLAITDHDIFIPHHELTEDDFLMLSGFEMTINQNGKYPADRNTKCCHLCFIAGKREIDIQPMWNPRYAFIGHAKEYHDRVKCEDIPYFEREYSPEAISEIIRIGREAGFFVTYNHPSWSQENYLDYTGYKNLNAMEIYNNSAQLLGYSTYAAHVYDDMLRTGERLYAVAADDNHDVKWGTEGDYDCGGGFVMIKAPELKYESIMSALFAGDFYASTGPTIDDLYYENETLCVKCSDAAMITLNTGVRFSKAARARRGESLNYVEFPLKLSGDEKYLRISVIDSEGNRADTRAYFIDELI